MLDVEDLEALKFKCTQSEEYGTIRGFRGERVKKIYEEHDYGLDISYDPKTYMIEIRQVMAVYTNADYDPEYWRENNPLLFKGKIKK